MSKADPDESAVPRFLFALAKAAKGMDGRYLGDPYTEKLLTRVLWWRMKDEQTGASKAAERVLAKSIGAYGCGRSVVTRRLRLLARYGVLRVTYTYEDAAKRYSTGLIEVDPELKRRLLGDLGFRPDEVRRAAAAKAAIGLKREESDIDLQGFDSDVPYGEVEPGQPVREAQLGLESPQGEVGTPAPRVDHWAEMEANAAVLKKETEKRERLEWKRVGDEFVTGCAKVWNAGQVQKGRPNQMPLWDGQPGNLPDVQRKNRRDLVKILEAEGGFRAALAWYVFNGFNPSDPGVVNFSFGHRLWITEDKPPATFSKHYSAITADPDFLRSVSDEHVRKNLVIAFGDQVLNTEPRRQRTQSLVRKGDSK